MRTYAEIDLDAAASNMREIKKRVTGKTSIMAVVKADAYGHGVLPMSKIFLENGADRLAVAFVDEGIQLRRSGVTVPIMLLGYTCPGDADRLLDYDITPTVFDLETARNFSDAAVKKHKKMKIHIKLDTGMTRIGFFCNTNEDTEEIKRQILQIASLPMIEIEGLFTHFSTADEPDGTYTRRQFACFCEMAQKLEQAGLHIPLKHVCNSAGTFLYPEMHLDLVRPGIVLYGLPPSDYMAKQHLPLKPVMTVKTVITQVKEVPAGTFVGYGNTYQTKRAAKIATVPIGYADGYFRAFSNRAVMSVEKTFCPVIGRICMDQCMIDVSDVNNISEGDSVTVFGEQFSAHQLAALSETISYELLCAVGKRVPRVYKQNNQVTEVVNPLLFPEGFPTIVH
ncbi:MAG: alanine racemase [Clostridia bacterium]|nr:alanine racemase [Clostridia bacterium]